MNNMEGNISIRYLQNYIKHKDYNLDLLKDYFLKLSEEVGELSRAMRKNIKATTLDDIKGTIDEELWDVVYYTLAIANLYNIDLEDVIKAKEAINQIRYPSSVKFEMGR